MRKLIVLCVVGVVGCSWAQMERASEDLDTARYEPRCTGTKGFAAEDFVGAIANGLAAVVYLSQTDEHRELVAVNGIAAALYLASGVTGLRWADECREIRARRDVVTADQADRLDRLDRPRARRIVPTDAGVAPSVDAAVDLDARVAP